MLRNLHKITYNYCHQFSQICWCSLFFTLYSQLMKYQRQINDDWMKILVHNSTKQFFFCMLLALLVTGKTFPRELVQRNKSCKNELKLWKNLYYYSSYSFFSSLVLLYFSSTSKILCMCVLKLIDEFQLNYIYNKNFRFATTVFLPVCLSSSLVKLWAENFLLVEVFLSFLWYSAACLTLLVYEL